MVLAGSEGFSPFSQVLAVESHVLPCLQKSSFTYSEIQPLLPEEAVCSGISAVGALQDTFKARSGSRTKPRHLCLLGLLLWNFLKVLSWKLVSPAKTKTINSHLCQLWPSTSTECKRSFLPALLLGASSLHSSSAIN